VLLLSRNDACQYLSKSIVVEITTTIRSIPVKARVGRREGLPSTCVANFDNIRIVARQWLDSRAGALAPSRNRLKFELVPLTEGYPGAKAWPERR